MPIALLKIWLTTPLAAALAAFLLFPGPARAENIVANPSAEQVAADGTPVAWGMYVGAGRIKLSAAADQKRSGQRSACLDLMGWYTPPGAADVPAQHSVSGAIVLAPNNGYGAGGALPCHPGDSYAFSFWYKGIVPSAAIGATGWPSAKADDTRRIGIAVSGAAIVPSGQWQRCTGRLRIPKGVERFVVMIQVSGKQDAGFSLGKLYVDDAEILPHNYPDGELRAVWRGLPKATERDAARREIATSLDQVQSAGLNAIFVWTQSR